ncbi:methyltransferase domain protein [Pyramidobacter piscolens W5455]|uniref:Methyltransferase domain protein n=1 Tax=Pyramidobacter piscolens W5455 TaxID=352165 RepID=A0ABM9ZU82_9BACT|nr:class I SAM-dependent methyltransferase [Pyramidobacter piscolens]EFB90480.1 methyltransferase domain protein [Pyramidobacter piscolens W5455]
MYYSGPARVSGADALAYFREIRYESLLDVGCGTGFLLDGLARQRRAVYKGLDISEGMIEIARGKKIPGAEFVLGSANKLPWADGTFDVVTCIQSFHHYPYADEAMREAHRVLKPGGLYLLSDTGVGGLGAWFDNHIVFPLLRSGDCHTENRHAIAARMERHGFAVIRNERLRGLIYTVVGRKPESQ